MQEQDNEFVYEPPESGEAEEEVNPYTTWVTIAGLVLAISMLGSLIFRAFPPRVLFGNSASGNHRTGFEQPRTVRVEADAGWVDSGLQLGPGAYRLTARGGVALDEDTPETDYLGPEGGLSICQSAPDQTCAMSGAPYGALVGRLDEGEPFEVGIVLIFEIRESGSLWLAVNDQQGSYQDNQKAFSVRVERYQRSEFEAASR